jgi:cellulose 1,4-beta-cellobiosidase
VDTTQNLVAQPALRRALTAAAAFTLALGAGVVATAAQASTASLPNMMTAAAPMAAAHVDNPYAGAGKIYVNQEWSKKAAAETGGSKIANQPTGVWLDSIAAITAAPGGTYTTSLTAHLDAAISQGAGLIQFVIYDLPGRDCAALASNGELKADEIDRYQSEYIDPIAEIMSDSKYADLRIVTIIEIDSLPNLITNVGDRETATEACDEMKSNGNYVKGIQYALNKLHAMSNVYTYIDAAHHGWIGWEDNFGATAQLMASTAKGTTAGVKSVDGFISNTANYSALDEPYVKVTEETKKSKWIDWNLYNDEHTFSQAFQKKLVSSGFPSSIGMLIDTSRNGWGGSARPTKASTASDLDKRIDESRIDRRAHKGNWCNQKGAGIGERPKASPKTFLDAYVWIKPPGESDGSSKKIENEQGKGFDEMCSPSYKGNPRNGNSPTSSLDGAPISGAWFSKQFQELVKNAYPKL